MTTKPNRAIERAFLENLNAQERAIRDQAWALESALSLEDKAWAGYRASPTLGDTAWDKEAYAGAVDKAAKDAAVFVLALAAAYARELKDQGLGGLI